MEIKVDAEPLRRSLYKGGFMAETTMTKGEATESLGIVNNKIWHLEEKLNNFVQEALKNKEDLNHWAEAGKCAYLIRKLNAKRYKYIAVIDNDNETLKIGHISENIGIGREDIKGKV